MESTQGPPKIEFANTLRGFAAVAVLLSHYYGVFWVGRDAVAELTNTPALPLASLPIPGFFHWLHLFPLLNWGAFGVALFFLVSGFVMPFSLKKMSWQGFAVSRFFRIVPTYAAGFSITLLAIYGAGWYFGRDWPFSAREVLVHYLPGIRDLLWSRSIDGIIWTLEIETKFYLVCALLIVWFRRDSILVFLAPVALFVLAMLVNRALPVLNNANATAWQTGMNYMMGSQYLIYMFIGVMFQFLHAGKIAPEKAYLGVGGLFSLFCIHWWAGPYAGGISVAWSYAFALLTFGFAYAFPRLFKANRAFDFLADISYPLYVVHAVAGYVVLRILLEIGWPVWAALGAVTLLCIALSWLVHVVVELPTQAIGRRLASALVVPGAQQPASDNVHCMAAPPALVRASHWQD